MTFPPPIEWWRWLPMDEDAFASTTLEGRQAEPAFDRAPDQPTDFLPYPDIDAYVPSGPAHSAYLQSPYEWKHPNHGGPTHPYFQPRDIAPYPTYSPAQTSQPFDQQPSQNGQLAHWPVADSELLTQHTWDGYQEEAHINDPFSPILESEAHCSCDFLTSLTCSHPHIGRYVPSTDGSEGIRQNGSRYPTDGGESTLSAARADPALDQSSGDSCCGVSRSAEPVPSETCHDTRDLTSEEIRRAIRSELVIHHDVFVRRYKASSEVSRQLRAGPVPSVNNLTIEELRAVVTLYNNKTLPIQDRAAAVRKIRKRANTRTCRDKGRSGIASGESIRPSIPENASLPSSLVMATHDIEKASPEDLVARHDAIVKAVTSIIATSQGGREPTAHHLSTAELKHLIGIYSDETRPLSERCHEVAAIRSKIKRKTYNQRRKARCLSKEGGDCAG